jgi:hypothetical protein
MAKWNQLSGRVAEEKRAVNYLGPMVERVHVSRAASRAERRAKDREVRLELKRISQTLPSLDPESDEFKTLDLRRSELEMYEASPHRAANEPYVRNTS